MLSLAETGWGHRQHRDRNTPKRSAPPGWYPRRRAKAVSIRLSTAVRIPDPGSRRNPIQSGIYVSRYSVSSSICRDHRRRAWYGRRGMTVEIPQQLGPIPTSTGALGGDAPAKGGCVIGTLPIVPSKFVKYAGTPFQQYILPIIPVGATLSPQSKISPDQLGKIPGRYNCDQGNWVGFKDWSTFSSTHNPRMLQHFQEWQEKCGLARRDRTEPARIPCGRHRHQRQTKPNFALFRAQVIDIV